MHPKLEKVSHQADVCVVGGGMAGLIAAVAAARRGARTVLIHDRPVLGGNASSEVRMWICGAHGPSRKEAGILEEIQLANLRRNPAAIYSVWDSVLFEFAMMTPGLTTLLNTTVNNGSMEDGHLVSVDAWQLTTQSWHRVEAAYFIDCSGDSILAPLSGAETRHGRECREEFGESLAPLKKDHKTMGNSLLLQLEETDRPQPFTPPVWAYRFDEDTSLPSRLGNGLGQNFWWIELGGLGNTIGDAETIRDELVKTAWGVWDYMKNKGGTAERLRNWRVRWCGALPGKRENRRYLGDHILTQNDIDAEGRFDDLVAYGGWSMDDHHPAGLYYPGLPTLFHKAPSPYGIPFRSLYSRNVPNLFCAGRNISATHCALSSTRVMATCSIMGQAVGTAAALCLKEATRPGQLSRSQIAQLQAQLMEDDCWLPGMTTPEDALMKSCTLRDSHGGAVDILRSGHERRVGGVAQHWDAEPGSSLEMHWDAPRRIASLRCIFDSDLSNGKVMPCRYPAEGHDFVMPKKLVKAFKVEVRSGASAPWQTVYTTDDNCHRRFVLPINQTVQALRWTGMETWGDPRLRVFSITASAEAIPPTEFRAPGDNWSAIVARLDPRDLQEPDHGLEKEARSKGVFGA